METQVHGWTLGEIAHMVGGELHGPADLRITRVVPAGYDDPAGVTFAENEKYLTKCVSSNVGALLLKRGHRAIEKPAIHVDAPRAAFGYLLMKFSRPLPIEPGVHPTAVVSPKAFIASSVSVGAYAVIEEGATIGAGCRIYPFSYIGDSCVLGDECTVYPHAVIYQDVVLGERCVVHAGAVLGADGFGFAWDGKRHVKVPQIGGVIVGDDVEIGANTCIDRATCGETIVEDGTKLDNLVQIAHNVSVGRDTVIAAHSGIGGSSTLGRNMFIGGHVAVSDHITLGDGVVVGGKSGVFQDIEEAGDYLGLPTLPVAKTMRVMALQSRLPELFKRLRQLEEEVEALRKND